MSNHILINNQPHHIADGTIKPASTGDGKSVSIKPLTVEIATLRVSNKQVTQSIFKQLPQSAAFDRDGNALGNLWGKVKYNFGEFTQHDGYHVLMEREGKLYRDWFSAKKEEARSIPMSDDCQNIIWQSMGMLLIAASLEENLHWELVPLSMESYNSLIKVRVRLSIGEISFTYVVIASNRTDKGYSLIFPIRIFGHNSFVEVETNGLYEPIQNIYVSDSHNKQFQVSMVKSFFGWRHYDIENCASRIEQLSYQEGKSHLTWDGLDEACKTVENLEQLFIAV